MCETVEGRPFELHLGFEDLRPLQDLVYVAAPWAPTSRAFVLSFGFTVLVAVNEAAAKSLHSTDHRSIYSGIRMARRGATLRVVAVEFGQYASGGDERLVTLQDVGMPEEWAATALEWLGRLDEEARRRRLPDELGQLRTASAERARLAREFSPLLVGTEGAHPEPNVAEWTVKLRAGRNIKGRYGASPPALLVKDEVGRIAARYILPDGPLLLEQEWQRRWAVQALQSSHHKAPTLQDPALLIRLEPFFIGAISPAHNDVDAYYIFADGRNGEFGIPLPDGRRLRVSVAIYYPRLRLAAVVSDEWATPVVNYLRRSGFEIDAAFENVLEHPSLDTSEVREKLSWNPAGWVTDDPIKKLQQEQHRKQGSQLKGMPSLTEAAAALLPSDVAETVREVIRNRHPYPDKVATLLPNHYERAVRVSPVLELPAAAADWWSSAYTLSPLHAPLLAAFSVRRSDPDWWTRLPWTAPRSTHPSDLTPAQRLETGQPALCDILASLDFPLPRLAAGPDDDDVPYLMVATQLWRDRVERVDPVTADDFECALCGTEARPQDIAPRMLHWAGALRYCPRCLGEATYGDRSPTSEKAPESSGELAAIRQLAESVGGPIALLQLRAPIEAGSPDERDRQVLLRIALRRWATTATAWYSLQRAAGIIGDEWRPARGTYVTATDGHRCRSIFERHVDDFFHIHNIVHEIEPQYPFDPAENTTGLRADWALAGGTLVEAAGLMNSGDYRAKIDTKRRLADRHGMRLIVVEPSDLSRLPDLFDEWLLAGPRADRRSLNQDGLST